VLIRVDMESGEPVWRQVADQLRALLVEGKLKPGAQLSTVRELAIDLGVNHNTIAMAYRILASEGFLNVERGKGAVVIERDTPPRAAAGEQERFLRRLRALLAEAEASGVSASALLKKVMP
jgi:DNA-binding transcriptional regulator YhcF (GntR family)